MTEIRDELADMVSISLRRIEQPTLEDIRTSVRNLAVVPPYSSLDSDAIASIVRQLESRHQVTMSMGSVLVDSEWKRWVNSRRAEIEPYYWNRYKLLLQGKQLSNQVVARIDSVTDVVLDLLQDPEDAGQWDRRGLVMGHVQSGKTSNFIGLVAKAADAGYRVVIIVAGLTNVLRKQTQQRVDEGFIGWDTAKQAKRSGRKAIGVGLNGQERPPVSYTSATRDFNAQTASLPQSLDSLNTPAVFVIKKNARTLESLVRWLQDYTAKGDTSSIDLPMLLIDDEADNASINTESGKNEISRINGQIRSILKLFRRSSYVGYTATPFANIFIDPDSDDEMAKGDLFPRDFIVSLDPPSNYVGPDDVFGPDARDYLRSIDDNESVLPVKHRTGFVVRELPDSLKSAIRMFVIGRAIRIIRGQGRDHSAMLINASVYNVVQRSIADTVQEFMTGVTDQVRVYGNMAGDSALWASPEIAALKDVYDNEFSECGASWGDIQAHLLEAIAPIDVLQINGLSASALDYDQYKESGRHVISVGGYSLSRGVTLEGLQVSYFLRNSMAYDTLMQMGRWFGYRDGYDDLCRIWMPLHASEWYSHVTEATRDLRDQLRSMEQAGANPKEFGLAVRAHPDTLIITARNKMGRSERVPITVGFADRFTESLQLLDNREVNQRNLEAVDAFIRRVTVEGAGFDLRDADPRGFFATGVPVAAVADFIRAFESDPRWLVGSSSLVGNYILRNAQSLSQWDVLVPSLLKKDPTSGSSVHSGLPINHLRRTLDNVRSNDGILYLSRKGKIASRGIEKAGLDADTIASAEKAFREDRQRDGKPVASEVNDAYYRKVRKRPLLVLHLLNLEREGNVPVFEKEPVASWSISFPPSEQKELPVEYFVNSTYLEEMLRAEEDEELANELA